MIRASILSCCAALIICIALSGAHAAGQFDGNWVGEDPADSKCGSSAVIVMQIINDQITGHVTGTRGTGYIKPTPIGPDGKAHIVYGGARLTFEANVKFSATRFDTDLNSACGGTRHMAGGRR